MPGGTAPAPGPGEFAPGAPQLSSFLTGMHSAQTAPLSV